MVDLDLPVVGLTPAPTWATKNNAALSALADAVNALPATDDAVMASVAEESSSAFSVHQRAWLAASTGLNVLDYGAVGDGVTDDTAAIQAAINAAAPGQAIIFPHTGSSAWYQITASLNITTPNLRFLGQPRDGYAVSIRMSVANGVMIIVKTTGFVLDVVALMGDGGINGAGATVDGVVFYGDTDGNIDANIRGATFQWLRVPVRTHGRNMIVDGPQTLVAGCLSGFVIDGPDATYNTGSDASQIRGITIMGVRFHNIGADSTTACIQVTTAAKLLHMFVLGCYQDSTGYGKFIIAAGTSTAWCSGITAFANKHSELAGDAYDLTYVSNSLISGAHILAYVGTGGNTARAVVLNNCDTVMITDMLGIQLGSDGIYSRNSTRVQIANVRFRAIGGDGFDIDSTNSEFTFSDVVVDTATGYGFNGSPTDSKLHGYEFRSCTAGTFNSNTLTPEQIWIPAQEFISITGTPNIIGVPGVGYPASWQFDASVVEQVAAAVEMMPPSWGSFNVVLMWAPTSSGTGNVVWQVSRSNLINGQLPSNGAASTNYTATAPGVTGQAQEVTVISNLTRPVNPLVIRVDRVATDAGDTYTADAALIGIRLVRAG
ncbi:MAG TPA: glycosyl hydrolase family 28-related protein [Humibacter sp.]|nr:glycosyl hydrolase family 28-related protein [Humibacter sp.]